MSGTIAGTGRITPQMPPYFKDRLPIAGDKSPAFFVKRILKKNTPYFKKFTAYFWEKHAVLFLFCAAEFLGKTKSTLQVMSLFLNFGF